MCPTRLCQNHIYLMSCCLYLQLVETTTFTPSNHNQWTSGQLQLSTVGFTLQPTSSSFDIRTRFKGRFKMCLTSLNPNGRSALVSKCISPISAIYGTSLFLIFKISIVVCHKHLSPWSGVIRCLSINEPIRVLMHYTHIHLIF